MSKKNCEKIEDFLEIISYIYFFACINFRMAGYVYIAENPEYPGRVKIGKTEDTIENRMKSLTRHSGVLGVFTCYYYVKVDNPKYVESLLHALFAEYRYQGNREFFCITPEKAKLAFMLIESFNLPEIEVEDDDDEIIYITPQEETESIVTGKRTPPFSFDELGIEIGENVYYFSNPDITARVISKNKVEYEGYEYSLSNLTGKLEDWKTTAYQGPLYWGYNGERLTELRKKKTTSI
jgi:hypothetical protein